MFPTGIHELSDSHCYCPYIYTCVMCLINSMSYTLGFDLQPILLSLRRGQASVSYAQSLVGAPETRLTALDNGLRVASEDTGHATCTVRTSFWFCI